MASVLACVAMLVAILCSEAESEIAVDQIVSSLQRNRSACRVGGGHLTVTENYSEVMKSEYAAKARAAQVNDPLRDDLKEIDIFFKDPSIRCRIRWERGSPDLPPQFRVIDQSFSAGRLRSSARMYLRPGVLDRAAGVITDSEEGFAWLRAYDPRVCIGLHVPTVTLMDLFEDDVSVKEIDELVVTKRIVPHLKEEISIWHDSRANFLPTRIEATSLISPARHVIEIELKELAKGVWLPKRIVRSSYSMYAESDPLVPDWLFTLTLGDDFVIGKHRDAAYRAEFVPGQMVFDKINDRWLIEE